MVIATLSTVYGGCLVTWCQPYLDAYPGVYEHDQPVVVVVHDGLVHGA